MGIVSMLELVCTQTECAGVVGDCGESACRDAVVCYSREQ